MLLRQIDRWIGRHMGPVRWVVALLLVSGIGVWLCALGSWRIALGAPLLVAWLLVSGIGVRRLK